MAMPNVLLESNIMSVLFNIGLCLFYSLLAIKYGYFTTNEITYSFLKFSFKHLK
jgi:hypothetical protein